MKALNLSFLLWILIIVSMAWDVGYQELLATVAIMTSVYMIVVWLIVITIYIDDSSDKLWDLYKYIK
jgi:hypothetical protein